MDDDAALFGLTDEIAQHVIAVVLHHIELVDLAAGAQGFPHRIFADDHKGVGNFAAPFPGLCARVMLLFHGVCLHSCRRSRRRWLPAGRAAAAAVRNTDSNRF